VRNAAGLSQRTFFIETNYAREPDAALSHCRGAPPAFVGHTIQHTDATSPPAGTIRLYSPVCA
jgi:hypothetical protein